MAIDKKVINYVSNLAMIKLTEQELTLLSRQLEDIVNFIDKLGGIDLTGIKPTSHILPISNVVREDKPQHSLSIEEVLGNAPARKDRFFSVIKVID